jgi:hypothetical protein
MMKISRTDVSAALGDVTDALAARLIATGADQAELAAAVHEIENNPGERGGSSSPRIQELCRIISDGLDDLDPSAYDLAAP